MLVYLAILMPVLLLFCGLVVDVGAMQFKRLQMQSACDAAATAAALEIERGTTAWATSAQGDAGVNGFTNGSNSVTVTAALRPGSGTFSGFYDAVQTTITQPQYTSFLKLLGKDPTTINVRSVAVVPPCVYVMGLKNLTQYQSPTSSYELTTTAATVNSGSASTASCPFYVNGQASVDANTAFSAMATNVTSTSGNAWNNTASVPPRYGTNVMSDPLAAITQPSTGSCAINGYPLTLHNSDGSSVSPATYCGTTTITCDSTSNVLTLNAGLYVIAGTLKVQNCTLTGTGVTLFFTKTSGSTTYGQFITTGTTITLTAPTTSSGGGIPGVLLMTDRAWSTSNAQDFILGTSTIRSDGIWYLTGAGMAINSGYFAAPTYAGIVADNLLVYRSTLSTPTNFSSVSGGNPFRPAGGVVE